MYPERMPFFLKLLDNGFLQLYQKGSDSELVWNKGVVRIQGPTQHVSITKRCSCRRLSPHSAPPPTPPCCQTKEVSVPLSINSTLNYLML